MHTENHMMLLLLYFVIVIVHGQLSTDELFFFNSKYTSTGNCTDLRYTFSDLKIQSFGYNELIFDCNSSGIIFRKNSSKICSDDESNLVIKFHNLSQTWIEINEIRLTGIELCSLDDYISNIYHEYSYYRSQWALLINFKDTNKQAEHHLAITTSREMTFILFLSSSESETKLIDNQIEIIFPNKNTFRFNQSLKNIWRIDKGFVHIPKSLEDFNIYQLSKSEFTPFNNETFVLYGTQLLNFRRFVVLIDDTQVACIYDYILQCTFPILPLKTLQPTLKVFYYGRSVFNVSLTLIPRVRLDHVPMNHSISDIKTFEVNMKENVCGNDSLKSKFSFIIHLWKIVNGVKEYQKCEETYLPQMDCNATAEIGKGIEKVLQDKEVLMDVVSSMDIDLIHQWYDHQQCRAERTRVKFV